MRASCVTGAGPGGPGQWEAAADDLDAYLRRQAEAVDAPQLRERLKALGRRHPPRRR